MLDWLKVPLTGVPADPFVAGHRYRVLRRALSFAGELTAGEVLKYRGASYDYRGGEYYYIFADASGEARLWIHHETDDAFAACRDIFEPIDGPYNQPLQRTGAAGILSYVRKLLGRGPGR